MSMIADADSNSGGRAALFAAMTDCGKVLIEAQRLEELLEKLYRSHPSEEGLGRWRVTRKALERLGSDYIDAIRRWREATEQDMATVAATKGHSASSPQRLRWYRVALCGQAN